MIETIGSMAVPKPEELKRAVSVLIEELEAFNVGLWQSCYEYHNLYTAFTTLLLMAGTGHRAVTDPFAFLADIDMTSRLLIINDKVVSPCHFNRMVAFPLMACKQLAAYLSHLQGLTCHLEKRQPEFAAEINSLLEKDIDKNDQAIPLLFFISKDGSFMRVSEGSLRKVLGSRWPYPMNVSRHIIESWLPEKNIPIWMIDLQLGHMNGFEHPFSYSHTVSPEKAITTLGNSLEILLMECGWRLVKGVFNNGQRINAVKYREKSKNRDLFGPESRLEQRRLSLLGVERYVSSLIKDEEYTYENNKPAFFTEENQKQIRETINKKYNLYPEQCIVAHKVFTRKIKEIDLKEKPDLFKKYQMPLRFDKTPVKDNWLPDFKVAKTIVDSFGNYLNRQSDKELILEKLWAEATVSAVLSGALYKKSLLKEFSDTSPFKVKKLKKICFIELFEKENSNKRLPCWRFVLDPVTRSLVNACNGFDDTQLDQERYNNFLINTVRELGLQVKDAEDAINILCQIGEVFWFYYLPPHLRAVMEGKWYVTQLSHTVLSKVILQRTIRLKLDGSNIKSTIEKEQAYRIFKSVEMASEPLEAKWFIKSVDAAIEDCQLINKDEENELKEIIKNEANSNTIENLTDKKKLIKLRSRLKSMADEKGGKYTQLGRCIVEWIADMCSKGVTKTDPIEITSIKRYFSAIKPLVEYFHESEFLELDSSEYTEIYRFVLDAKSDKNNFYRADTIRRFHMFVMRRLGIDNAEWGEMGVDWAKKIKANANIITPFEYQEIIRLVYNHDFESDAEKLWIMALIILGYRFGLRLGEGLRLKYTDIQIIESSIFTQVQKHRKKGLKTEASVRQVPGLQLLSDIELECLRRTVEAARLKYSRYKQYEGMPLLLFPDSDNVFETINRAMVSEILCSIMRQVCRDNTLVYHHLRHSSVTSLFVNLTFPENSEIYQGFWSLGDKYLIQSQLLGREPMDNRELKSISGHHGHSQQRTTLENYFHLCDFAIYEVAKLVPISTLSLKGVEYCLGKTNVDVKAYDYSENIDGVNNAYEQLLARKHTANIEFKVPTYQRAVKLLVNKNIETLELGLKELDAFFVNFAEERRIERLATLLNSNVATANHLLGIGAKIQEESGLVIFNLDIDIKDRVDNVPPKSFFETFYVEKKIRSDLYVEAQNLLKEMKAEEEVILREGLEAWKNAYHLVASHDELLFEKYSKLKSFLDMMSLFGFKQSSFYGLLPNMSEDEIDQQKINLALCDIHLSDLVSKENVVFNFSLHGQRVKALSLKRDSKAKDKLNYIRSINHFLFILNCYLSYKTYFCTFQ